MSLHEVQSADVLCPFCGESIELLVDPSVPAQDYIEDCEVCCRPMEISVRVGPGGEVRVRVSGEAGEY